MEKRPLQNYGIQAIVILIILIILEEKFYYYILKVIYYLKKNNLSSIYPNYILDINNETGLENTKIYFKNLAKDYYLDEHNELYIKNYKKYKNNITIQKDFDLLKIPFTRDLKVDIYNIHKNIGHKNANIVRWHIISKNYVARKIINLI